MFVCVICVNPFANPLAKMVFFIFVSLYSGTLVNSIGFEWMLVGIAILCFIYAPLLTFLRAPPTKEEKKVCVIGVDNPGMMINEANDGVVVVVTNNGNTTENCVTKL